MRLTNDSSAASLPTIISYQQHQQARRRAILDQAYHDGTYAGFILGALFAGLVWLVLSGTLLRLVLWAAWTWLTLLDGRV